MLCGTPHTTHTARETTGERGHGHKHIYRHRQARTVSLDHLHDELRDPLDHLRRVAAVEREELEAVHQPLHPLFLERVQMTSPRAVGDALVNRAQRRCRPRTHGTRRKRRHTIHLLRRDTEDIRYREQDRRAIRIRESLLDLVLQALVSS